MIRLLQQRKTSEYQDRTPDEIKILFSGVQYCRNKPSDIADIIKLLSDVSSYGNRFEQNKYDYDKICNI